MIEAGLYVAQRDFWSPDSVQSGVDAEGERIDRYPDTVVYTSGFFGGSFDDFVFVNEAAQIMSVGTGFVEDVIVSFSGTDIGTAAIISLGTGYVEDVVFTAYGTNYGTAAFISLGTGQVTDVVFTAYGTNSGTAAYVSLGTGYLFDAIASAGLYTSYGTFTAGFLSGAHV